MTIRDLIVRLGVDADDEALTTFERGLKSVKRTMLAAAKAAAALAAAAGGVTAAFVSTANQTAKYSKEILTQSKAVGASVEEYQKLAKSVQKYGGETKDVQDVLSVLADRADDAMRGTASFVEAFQILGIEAKELEGLNPQEIFYKVADSVKEAEDPVKRLTALERMLGGQLGQELIPLLQKGSEGIKDLGNEFDDLGAIIDESALRKSREFGLQTEELIAAADGLRHQFGAALAPAILGTVKRIKEWITTNREWINQKLEQVARSFGVALEYVADTVAALNARVDGMGGWSAVLSEIANWLQIIAALAAGWYAYTTVIPTITSALSILAAVLPAVWGQVAALSSILWTGGVPALTAFASGVWASLAPLLPFIAAAVAVGAVVYDLINYFRTGDSAILGFLNSFSVGRSLVGALSEVFSGFWEILKAIGAGLYSMFVPIWEIIKTAVWLNMLPVIGLLKLLWSILKVAFDAIATAAGFVFPLLQRYFETVFAEFARWLRVLADGFKQFANWISRWMKWAGDQLYSAFEPVFEWVLSKLSALAGGFEWIKDRLEALTGINFDDQEQKIRRKIETEGGGSVEESVFGSTHRRKRQKATQRRMSSAMAPSREAGARQRQRAAAARNTEVRGGDTTIEKIEVNEAGDPEKTRDVIEEALGEHEAAKLRKFQEMLKGSEV